MEARRLPRPTIVSDASFDARLLDLNDLIAPCVRLRFGRYSASDTQLRDTSQPLHYFGSFNFLDTDAV